MTHQLYIMSPDMFKQLASNTIGFERINGATYQEYIIKKFDNILLEEQKNKILNASNAEEALDLLLEYNINYTHYF